MPSSGVDVVGCGICSGAWRFLRELHIRTLQQAALIPIKTKKAMDRSIASIFYLLIPATPHVRPEGSRMLAILLVMPRSTTGA